ncbi:CASP8 and FADD-like apoptosis regulator [Tiliqua scincoides]|uniref:CASP8 and FADD-like apoptosis regulator n=1 Tax=Tiliqua scincoides TaxID=71010 RepID=UPI0034622FC6
MTVDKVPASLLHQIEQELDADERETMVFLCRDLVPDLPVPDIRKLWVALNERESLTLVTLSELLYRVRRFDLLKKLLKMGRASVEADLVQYPRMVSNYRVMMTEISQDLDKEDLASLAFLLMDDLAMSYGKVTKEKSFLAIIVDLEKLDLVSPNQLGIIENCLLSIHRKDLAKRIQKFKQEAKEIQLSVPETGASIVQVPDQYKMQSQPLGICLIIDCVGNDAGMLVNTFNALHFEVRCRQFLSASSMNHELYEVARLKEHKDYDCFVCVLISRGNHQELFCTNHVVPGFPLERVKNYFSGDKCPGLLGKPKLFFIQNYVEPGNQQENTDLLEADGDLYTIPQGADILWSQSMLGASTLERSPHSSSYYLSTLTELLIDPRKRRLPLLDILVELNDKVYEWNRTNPAEHYSLLLKHTLRKKLFFSHPC